MVPGDIELVPGDIELAQSPVCLMNTEHLRSINVHLITRFNTDTRLVTEQMSIRTDQKSLAYIIYCDLLRILINLGHDNDKYAQMIFSITAIRESTHSRYNKLDMLLIQRASVCDK